MNERNLKPVASRPPEERRSLAAKAGRASVKRRRELKAARDLMRELMALPLKDFSEYDTQQKDAAEWLTAQGVKERDQSQLMALLFTLHRRALRGDVRAIETSLKLAGEWPADKQEIITTEKEPETRYRFTDVTAEQATELIRQCYEQNARQL